jgi:hypothetical protein
LSTFFDKQLLVAAMHSKKPLWRISIVKNHLADLNNKQILLADMDSKESFWRTSIVKNPLAWQTSIVKHPLLVKNRLGGLQKV